MAQRGRRPGDWEEPEDAAEATSWLPILLGFVCTVRVVVLLFGLVYLKAGRL